MNLDSIFSENLNNFDIKLFIDNCKKCNIGLYVCMVKVIKILSKTRELNDIISIILSHSDFNTTEEEIKALHTKYSNLVLTNIPVNPFKISNQNFLIEKIVDVHKHLPEPIFDSFGNVKMLPKIDLKKCQHRDCKKTFPTSDSLITHLVDNECYQYRWHVRHEEYYNYIQTKASIIAKNITKCNVCHFGTTTQELIDHLTVLGLPGFCDNISTFNTSYNNLFKKPEEKKDNITKIYTHDECVICYDSKPQTLLYPCLHNSFCVNCIKTKPNCPLCRTKITSTLIF